MLEEKLTIAILDIEKMFPSIFAISAYKNISFLNIGRKAKK